MPKIVTTKKRASSKQRSNDKPSGIRGSGSSSSSAPAARRSSSQRPRADSRRGTLPSFTGPTSPFTGTAKTPHGATLPTRSSMSEAAQRRASFAAATQPAGRSRLVPSPPRSNGETSVSLFAVHNADPSRPRMSVMFGAESSSTTAASEVFPSHYHGAATSYSSQVRPSWPRAMGSRRSTTSRVVRGVSQTVAVTRLQRAARLFLLRRALRQIPLVADAAHSLEDYEAVAAPSAPQLLVLHDGVAAATSGTTTTMASSSGHDDTEEEQQRRRNLILVLEVPPPATESRMVRRIRAELHRAEQLRCLRASIARRTLTAALLDWVHRFQAKKHAFRHRAGAGLTSSSAASLPQLALWPPHSAEVVRAVGAACTVQAVLRARRSGVAVADLDAQRRRRAAAMVILRAWRRSPLHATHLRRLHDRQVREVLERHEAVERRDLLRRHLQFLVRCHQQLYNHPCMWEAGVALRRLPLYAPEGLYLSESTGAHRGGPLPLSSVLTEDRASSPPATLSGLLRRSVSPTSAADAAAAVTSDEVDVELRRCQYRLFFSPEDRQLWEEEKEAAAAAERNADIDTSASVSVVVAATARPPVTAVPGSSRRSPPPTDSDAEAPSYAKAFATALTFLRKARADDPVVLPVLRHMQALRSDPVQLQRLLVSHGHLPAELVAPLTCYGSHLQRVARGEEDEGVLSATPAMRVCTPLVVGVMANPAVELRGCLVGVAVRGSNGGGGGVDGRLPLPLEECRCRREAMLRRRRVAGGSAAEEEEGGVATWGPAAASLQRSGFASAATQALFESADAVPPQPPQPQQHQGGDEATAAGRGAGETAEQRPSEWDHRLATGVGEVGAAWRGFLLSIPLPAASASALSASSSHRHQAQSRPGPKAGKGACPSLSTTPFGAAALPERRYVGLCSHLVPASAAASPVLLLRSFEPAPPRPSTEAADDRPQRVMAANGCSASPPESLKAGAANGRGRAVSTVLRMDEWWDAVERLLIQERVRRGAAEHNEAEQRRSIHLLRRMAPIVATSNAVAAVTLTA